MLNGSEQEQSISLSREEVIVTSKDATTDQSVEITRSLDELPEEVQKKLHKTYADIVKKEINNKLKSHLARFLEKLESPELAELKSTIIANLNPEDKQLYQSFMDPSQQKKMSYENVCKLYRAVQASVKTNEKDLKQISNRAILNAARNGLDAMHVFVDYNIPSLVEKAKKITVMQETRFIRMPKKKSFFRRLIETVFPFFKKQDDEIITKKIEEKMTSPEKMLLSYATDAVAEYFSKSGDDYFKAFDNAVEYKQQVAKGKAMDLMPTQKQAIKEQEKTKELSKPKSKVKKTVEAAKAVVQVAVAVDTGVNEWIAAKLSSTTPGAFLEQALKPDTDVQQTTLAEYFRNEFMMASQKEAYGGMVHFTRRLAELYITANRVKQTGYVDMSAEQFGFKRLDDPKFEIFLSRLVGSLGYPMKGFEDLQNFLSSTVNTNDLHVKDFPSVAAFERYKTDLETEQQAAFKKFAGALPHDPALGIHAAVTLLSKEHAATMQNKGNENYFYLLNLQQQAIKQLQSNERVQNAVALACKQTSIEESLYSPDHGGLVTRITGQLKGVLVGKMPELVQGFIHDAHQLQENANNQFDVISENWLSQISVMQEQAIEAKTKAEPKGMSVTELRNKWDKSAKKSSKLAFQFDEVKQLVDKFHESAMKQWKDSTISLMKLCGELQGPDFLNEVIKQLNDKYVKLQAQGAHESYSKEVQKQIVALKGMLLPDGKGFNPKMLKAASPEILKSSLDALNNGIATMSQDSQLSLDKKENLYMMSQALMTMNNSYRTFDLAKKAYEEVYRTNFDELNNMPSSKVATFIAKKLGAELETSLVSSMDTPIVQFEFYAKQKMAGLHSLPDIKPEAAANKPQSWWDWGKDQVAWAASYVAPIAGPVAAKAAEIAALPVLIGAGSAYLAKLYLTDVTPSAESVNQAVCNNAKVFIREQAYDAMVQLLPEMFGLCAAEQTFQQNHADVNYDPFKECGLSDRKRFYDLMNNIAKGLGYASITEYIDFENEIASKQAEVEKCKQALHATWIYKSEPQAKLTKAEEELAFLLQIKEDKRKQFCRLPKNQAELDTDLFVTLKDAIQTEYAALTADIQKGRLGDGTNYLVLVSSINALVQQIELVQKETIAAELFAPDIDDAIGYDPQNTGVMAQLKLAGREDLKTVGTQLARKGILSQLTGAIDTARYFSAQMISAVSENMDIALKKHIESTPMVSASTGEQSRRASITTAFRQDETLSLNKLPHPSGAPAEVKKTDVTKEAKEPTRSRRP